MNRCCRVDGSVSKRRTPLLFLAHTSTHMSQQPNWSGYPYVVLDHGWDKWSSAIHLEEIYSRKEGFLFMLCTHSNVGQAIELASPLKLHSIHRLWWKVTTKGKDKPVRTAGISSHTDFVLLFTSPDRETPHWHHQAPATAAQTVVSPYFCDVLDNIRESFPDGAMAFVTELGRGTSKRYKIDVDWVTVHEEKRGKDWAYALTTDAHKGCDKRSTRRQRVLSCVLKYATLEELRALQKDVLEFSRMGEDDQRKYVEDHDGKVVWLGEIDKDTPPRSYSSSITVTSRFLAQCIRRRRKEVQQSGGEGSSTETKKRKRVGGSGGITREGKISRVLGEFVAQHGPPRGTSDPVETIPRVDCVSIISAYIKNNNLQGDGNKVKIDAPLSKLMMLPPGATTTWQEKERLLSHHFIGKPMAIDNPQLSTFLETHGDGAAVSPGGGAPFGCVVLAVWDYASKNGLVVNGGESLSMDEELAPLVWGGSGKVHVAGDVVNWRDRKKLLTPNFVPVRAKKRARVDKTQQPTTTADVES